MVDPGYLGGPAGWTPRWSRFGGVWLCPIYVPNQDRSDVYSYEVFLDDINEEVCRKFRQHACEVAALLERLGCELSVGICRESELVRTLFERNRAEIHWEENEEPGHPETKSLIGRLKDIYGHTESFLIDLLDEFAPPSLAQHLQVAQEIEVDRQDGKADNESGPTTMASVKLLSSSEPSPPATRTSGKGGADEREGQTDTPKKSKRKPRRRLLDIHAKACIKEFRQYRKLGEPQSMREIVKEYVATHAGVSESGIYRRLTDNRDQWAT